VGRAQREGGADIGRCGRTAHAQRAVVLPN
jgi:predicted RNA-binding protein YlqC (UPF0109 family)